MFDDSLGYLERSKIKVKREEIKKIEMVCESYSMCVWGGSGGSVNKG